jgi:hypothetical protein
MNDAEVVKKPQPFRDLAQNMNAMSQVDAGIAGFDDFSQIWSATLHHQTGDESWWDDRRANS